MCSYRAACGCDHTAFNLKHFIIDGLQRRTGVAFCPPVLDMEQTKIMEKVVDESWSGEFGRKGIKDFFGGVGVLVLVLLVCQEFVPSNGAHVRKRPCMFLDSGLRPVRSPAAGSQEPCRQGSGSVPSS